MLLPTRQSLLELCFGGGAVVVAVALLFALFLGITLFENIATHQSWQLAFAAEPQRRYLWADYTRKVDRKAAIFWSVALVLAVVRRAAPRGSRGELALVVCFGNVAYLGLPIVMGLSPEPVHGASHSTTS